ncbi:MAG TPA: hypothetical protein VJ853_10130, partial [Thermoanaerobaculia bacterium]|nr:hypothetical protein [Thermoanaerobaculia bacterium]
MIRRFALLAVLFAASASARVLSYAPYTDHISAPAVQSRLNRHFVLLESPGDTPVSMVVPQFIAPSQVVVYDSTGAEEPRVVYPRDGSLATLSIAAAREENGVVTILVQNLDAQDWLLSTDSGATWRSLNLKFGVAIVSSQQDRGGKFVSSRYSPLRIGTSAVPFVIDFGFGTYGVQSNGDVKVLLPMSADLIGSDRDGARFLARDATDIWMFDVNGNRSNVGHASLAGSVEGWITPDGGAFLEHVENTPSQVILWYARNGSISPVAASWDGPLTFVPLIDPAWIFFAVPTADYSGAWIVKEGGRPSSLSLLTPSAGLVTQWQDVSQPQIEALIPSQSGDKVLVQVHRPRASSDNLMFKDPALAVWHVGAPAPAAYDELFLSESPTKQFVHVDVDTIESGNPFVFDSGFSMGSLICLICSPPPPSAGGGSDVAQEWGVVRSSLQQYLIIPGVGRAAGAYGSNWATDVTLYNPTDSPLIVDLVYWPNRQSYFPELIDPPPGRDLTLAPREIRTIHDVVGSFFSAAGNTTGVLHVTPFNGSVNVTARTYNTTAQGSFGFTMNGIDMFTAAGPRFPLTFAGAFEGAGFRTNVFLADTSGRGTSVKPASTATGTAQPLPFDTVANGSDQFNSIGPIVGIEPNDTGALVLQPMRGDAIASVFVIDNRTNDPTFFPPDLPASVQRVIPAIGHVDGANGSQFRSDLFLFNNSSQSKTVVLTAQPWTLSTANAFGMLVTLQPHESRVIRDVLLTMFQLTGIARLRYSTVGSTNDTSVRVTSRTYSVDANGGTYGFEMPPLNSFQSGSPGDTLEILGASLDPHFRTNLGLVELSASIGPTPGRARVDIVDDHGLTLDSFEISIPAANGLQIDDLFHARGLTDSGKPVLVRVTVIQGSIGAYGAFIDNGTNDP